MSYSFNKVTLIGLLGADAVITPMSNGTHKIAFPLATNEFWIDKVTKEKKTRTDWHKVVAYDKFIDFAEDQLKKGSKVKVVGQIIPRQWSDANGTKHTIVEIVAIGTVNGTKGSVMVYQDNNPIDWETGLPKEANAKPKPTYQASKPQWKPTAAKPKQHQQTQPVFEIDDEIPF